MARVLRGVFSINLRKSLKSRIFRHLLALPEDFLRSRGAGYFFNRIQHDIGEICTFTANGALSLPCEGVKLIVAMGMISLLDWRCALLVLPFLLLQGGVCYFFRKKQYALSMQLQECVASERHIMQEFLSNHTALKTHDANRSAGERIDSGLKRWGKLMFSRLTHENIFLGCLQLPIWLCGGVILLGGLYLVIQRQTTLGQVWALLLLMNLVFAPSRTLGTLFVQQQSASAAWVRLQEVWQQQIEADSAESASAAVDLRGDLLIKDVDFAYQSNRRIISKLNLHVPYGSGVFLCGANGSGKSTLFSLLMRLYKPQSGVIRINGGDIADYPLGAYRSRIGYIGQHPEFIRGTLRENLLLGNCSKSDLEIEAVFRQLDCAYLLDRLAEGLDSQVAERGENFSGGERLRLALVRELLRENDWLLLDEAAANLDIAGRQTFYNLLQKLPGNKSVIAIVHDLPENSDWPILHLEDLQKK
jgi:ABC-type bacteriocin/lantibiotic exporter with double-glycine peptidase domain